MNNLNENSLEPVALFIAGKFVPSIDMETLSAFSPFDGSVIGQFYKAKANDVDLAVEAAYSAFYSGPWKKITPKEIGEALAEITTGLKKNMSQLIKTEILDAGSTQKKAREDVFLSIKCMNYYTEWASGRTTIEEIANLSRSGIQQNFIQHDPVGVCAAIIPWNFPLKMAVWKIAQALATGNTIVLKPSEETVLSAYKLAEIISQTSIPDGVVNIVAGIGNEAGEALVKHPKVDKISFTGSTDVGKKIMALASETLKNVTLECGGKSANIVLDDVEIDLAVDGAIYSMFYHSGQCCEAGTLLFLPEKFHDKFVEQLITKVKNFKVGDPSARETHIGPLISERQQKRVLGYIEKAKEHGATLVIGGGIPDDVDFSDGYFVEPTIFTEVTMDMAIAQEEIFGPVLCVLKYNDETDLLEKVNGTKFGLAGGIWSSNRDRAFELAKKIRTGTVWINDYHLIDEKAPFGGYKQSGIGREFGDAGASHFTEAKHIHWGEIENKERTIRMKTIVPS